LWEGEREVEECRRWGKEGYGNWEREKGGRGLSPALVV